VFRRGVVLTGGLDEVAEEVQGIVIGIPSLGLGFAEATLVPVLMVKGRAKAGFAVGTSHCDLDLDFGHRIFVVRIW